MEEQPNGGPLGIYSNNGEDCSANQSKTSVNNDQSHRQFQDEETQTQKTENGKINGTAVEGEEIPSCPSPVSVPLSNDRKGQLESTLNLRPPRRAFAVGLAGGSKGNYTFKSSMDCRNDKPSDLKILEGKKETLSSLNGIVTLNGYSGLPGVDNDGSGSESGYTTPKKRRSQRSGKTGDSLATSQVKSMQPVTVPPEEACKAPDVQITGGRTPANAEPHPGLAKARDMPVSGMATPCVPLAAEPQRKNSDGKASGAVGKKFEDRSGKVKVAATVSTKEDSWTLFKPPPVFPVDNSSAKIVPKISYASKVKENLNKTAQSAAEGLPPPQPPQVPGRLSQVPMSAVKTITSAGFSNGPLLGEGNGCHLPGPFFSSMAGSESPLSASPVAGAENVASSPGSQLSGCVASTGTDVEPRKPSLFVYPVAPSNMHFSLPSGRQADPPTTQTNQKSLGDIFQNQWGLSFINEPSAGPEAAVCRPSGQGKPVEVTFQGSCSAAIVVSTSTPPTPPLRLETPAKALDPDKRTSSLTLSAGPNPGSARAGCQEGPSQASVSELEPQKDQAGGPGALVFCSSSVELGTELSRTSPGPNATAGARDQGRHKGFDRRLSWGTFDQKAAVIYHTKEMEYVLNLQKQDPCRVVLYGESKDGPDH